MKQAFGWYWPDHEQHMLDWVRGKGDIWMGRHAYQGVKIRHAIAIMKPERLRVAVDVGAHVGLWSFYLSMAFKEVVAFEPIEEHRQCWRENMAGRDNATLYPYAIGDEDGTVGFHTEPGSSGDSSPSGKGEYPVKRLDDLLGGMALPVDLVKVDCEGYEYFVLHGGEQLIKASRPVVVVEQKIQHKDKYGLERLAAVGYLRSLGMTLEREISGDYFMVWPK
jgi:FkbM family methyltransferase